MDEAMSASAAADEIRSEVAEPEESPELSDSDVIKKLEEKITGMDDAPASDDLLADDTEAELNAFKNLTEDVLNERELNQEQVQRYTQKAQELFQTKTLLDQKYNEIPWEELRQTNPDQWSAMQIDFRTAYNQLQNEAANLGQVEQAMQQKQAEARQKQIKSQVDRMHRLIPEWQDPNVKSKELGQLKDFLRADYGFQGKDLDNVLDARLVKLARDALKYKQKSKAKPKPPPKFRRKPKQPAKESYTDDEIIDRLMERL